MIGDALDLEYPRALNQPGAWQAEIVEFLEHGLPVPLIGIAAWRPQPVDPFQEEQPRTVGVLVQHACRHELTNVRSRTKNPVSHASKVRYPVNSSKFQ